MEISTLKYPVVLVRDAQEMILKEMNSESTQKYLDNTTFSSKEEQWAFRSGMNYVGLLLATRCYNFGHAMVSKEDIKNIEDYYEERNSKENL